MRSTVSAYSPSEPGSAGNTEDLRARLRDVEAKLAEAHELIHAIQSGDVDAVVVSGPQGEQVFTLRGAEYAYRALVESMNEGAATLAADGAVLYCNQHLSILLGKPIEQIIGHRASQLLSDEGDRFDLLLAHALSGDSAKAEVQPRSADGRRIPLHISLRKMHVDGPTAVCMVVTDLTESRKWEELVAAGRLANVILEGAADAMAVCDEGGKVVRGNKALEDLCGFNPLFQQFENALPLQIVGSPGSDASERRFKLADLSSNCVLQGQEVSFRRCDGRVVYLLLSFGPVSGSSGVLGFVLTLTDITNRKRVTQALIESEKLASVGRLASTIAHEINNPLEAIGNALFLASNSPETSPLVKSYLDIASQELERATHVTRQTLAFHRDEKSPMPIDLRESLEGVLNIFAGRLKTKTVAIECRYTTSEPVQGVSGEIRQIVSNLLSNSMDALSPDGRLCCRVACSLGRGESRVVRLTIADTGSGIPAENMKNIFEPFFTTKEFVGTGLGLWITKQIVERHGAKIRVRSKPHKGTVVSVMFPALDSNREASA